MGIFDKLFGKKPPEPPAQARPAPPPMRLPKKPSAPLPHPPPSPAPAASQAPAPAPALPASPASASPQAVPASAPTGASPTIQASADDQRALEAAREESRKILPDQFKKSWEAPEDLAALIATCLRDGFVAECLDGARQLQRIDQQPRRAAGLLSATLLHLRHFDEAEKVLKEALQKHGEDGTLLTNLAKCYAERGGHTRAERALWRALEVDPNHENGLLWHAAMHREKGGPKAEVEALRRVAALPGSWRAQLWLARHALQAKEVPSALALYREALLRMKPVTADALAQISGDLASNGLPKELIDICGPLFNAKEHGVPTGNHLLKAYVDRRDAPGARRILDQLSVQQRPDWREQLLFWEGEIAKLDKGVDPVNEAAKSESTKSELAKNGSAKGEPAKMEIQFLTLEGPLWARAGTPFSEVLPAKSVEALKVAFCCGSAEMPAQGDGAQMIAQPTDAIGRFSRGLPLFLAERIHIKTSASATTLVPWVKAGGFVLAGEPWTLDALASVERKPDFAVLLHVIATQRPWSVKFAIWRVSDGKAVSSWEVALDPKEPAPGLNAIAKRTLSEIHALGNVALLPASDSLFPPTIGMLPQYVAGLDQALAVYCSALAPETRPVVQAERNILDSLIEMSLRETDNTTMRMLLLSTAERESKARPEIAREYRPRLERLQREHPLRQPAKGLTDAALTRIY